MATRPPVKAPKKKPRGGRFLRFIPEPWRRRVFIGAGITAGIMLIVLIYAWIRVAGMIDRRLGGGDDRPMPRIYGRAFEMRPGQPLSIAELRARLNDVGYSEKAKAENPGEFAIAGSVAQLVTKGGGKSVSARVEIGKNNYIAKVTAAGPKGAALESVKLEPPLLAELSTTQRRRYVPLGSIPKQLLGSYDIVISVTDSHGQITSVNTNKHLTITA